MTAVGGGRGGGEGEGREGEIYMGNLFKLTALGEIGSTEDGAGGRGGCAL